MPDTLAQARFIAMTKHSGVRCASIPMPIKKKYHYIEVKIEAIAVKVAENIEQCRQGYEGLQEGHCCSSRSEGVLPPPEREAASSATVFLLQGFGVGHLMNG